MSDFRVVEGFEDVWRPPVRPNRRRPEAVLHAGDTGKVRDRLARLAARAPEVMVKVTGRTLSPRHLRAHLDYITRHGALEAEDQDRGWILGRSEVRELAEDWSALALADRRRRETSPFSHSIVLSMPAGTDAALVRNSARAFAREVFGGQYDYVMVLHTDTTRPHVHVSVCSRGNTGARLTPKKADLELWRQVFAQALRDRGVEAEATPRRARGVTRKAERGPLRRIRERHSAGRGPVSHRLRCAYQEAAGLAFGGDKRVSEWERRLLARQATIRALYLAQARLLVRSPDPGDRDLAARVDAWVRAMAPPESQRLALARELRAANRSREASLREAGQPAASRDRER